MEYKDSFERREEYQRELIAARVHDCKNDRENCDNVHPNIELIKGAPTPFLRNQDVKPPNWRDWMLQPKTGIMYMNRHTLKMEMFNVGEAFSQMSTNGKLNTVHNIIANCLDDEERSLLLATYKKLRNKMNSLIIVLAVAIMVLGAAIVGMMIKTCKNNRPPTKGELLTWSLAALVVAAVLSTSVGFLVTVL